MSVSLAHFDAPDDDKVLIGCSQGFLALSGLHRREVLGQNCRFLNQRAEVPVRLRDRLRQSVKTGIPFLGVLNNIRHLGEGGYETFQNLLHLVVIVAGTRKYILGIQSDVTGLNLQLADGSQDALRLKKMFDSVLSAGVDSWIHIQEGAFEAAPLYLYIRHSGSTGYDAQSQDEVAIVEGGQNDRIPQLLAPDQNLVLAPQFSPHGLQDGMKWNFVLLGDSCWPSVAEPGVGGASSAADPGLPINGSQWHEGPAGPAPAGLQLPVGALIDPWQQEHQGLGAGPAVLPVSPASSHQNSQRGSTERSPVSSFNSELHSNPLTDARRGRYESDGGRMAGSPVVSLAAELQPNPVKISMPMGNGHKRREGYSSEGGGAGYQQPGWSTGWPQTATASYATEDSNASSQKGETSPATGTSTMKNRLQALMDNEDPKAIIIARGISKLGLQAGDKLRIYLSQIGGVKEVYIPFVYKKKKHYAHTEDEQREQRAPGRGFIVMDSAEDVYRVLGMGEQHYIQDICFSLEAFQASNVQNTSASRFDSQYSTTTTTSAY